MAKTMKSGNLRRNKAQPQNSSEKKGKVGRKKKELEDRLEEAKAKRSYIKALFESRSLVKLKEIEHAFTKAMADQIGINHGRLIDKLKNPIRFSMKDIYRFSYYVNIDPLAMMIQIKKEVDGNAEVVKKLQEIKPLKEKKKTGTKSSKSGRK